MKLFNYIIVSIVIASTIGSSDISKCNLCKDIVDIAEVGLHMSNRTLHDIEILVEELCHDIGGNIIWKECIGLIDNIQMIINYLMEGWTSSNICEKLGYC